jgi:2-C-methyl-D-erythritol 4-phosphate cytidylyltransferase
MKDQLWAIIPAAGSGQRLGNAVPKQYLRMLNVPVIQHAIEPFLQIRSLNKIVVVVAEHDQHWQQLPLAQHHKIVTANGAAARYQTVFNGLMAIDELAHENDWVLIHDAARPCIAYDDIMKLITGCQDDEVGGLLAAPIADTLKLSATNQRVMQTVPRDHLWRALTPQLFRYGTLFSALRYAINENIAITDEAMAIELLGLSPKIVPGRADNIKVTYPEDLRLAEFILQERKDKKSGAIKRTATAEIEN